MTTKDEALKLAENALKRVRTQDMELVQMSMIALAAIREALEQPAQPIKQGWDVDTLLNKPKQPAQQEPVAHCEAGPECCPVCHKELNPEPAIYPDEAYEMGLEEVAFYTSPPASKPCEWQREDDIHMPDTWRSDCGVLWTFTEGGPVDNDMKYCCGCGATLREKNNA